MFLDAVGSAVVVLDFTFIPGLTLTQVDCRYGTTHNTSYSGTVNFVPVPPTVSPPVGSGLLGWGLLRRKWSLKK